MIKRTAIFALLAVVVLSATAWAAGEELVYSLPFVSVNSPLKLCATATDDNGPVSGVGLWFQAWTPAGIPRTNGPLGTVFTNALGKACNNFNLNEGLYVVQAFGTDGFDGVPSDPVIVSNWKTRLSIEATSAGVATYRLGNGETCDAVFGILIQRAPYPAGVQRVTIPGGNLLRSITQFPSGQVEQFLWLDECNPDAPIRIEVDRFWSSLISQSTFDSQGQIILQFNGFADITTGSASFRGWMEFRVDTGEKYRMQPVNDKVCLANGTFELKLTRLNGQIVYDITGPFRGTTCSFFPF